MQWRLAMRSKQYPTTSGTRGFAISLLIGLIPLPTAPMDCLLGTSTDMRVRRVYVGVTVRSLRMQLGIRASANTHALENTYRPTAVPCPNLPRLDSRIWLPSLMPQRKQLLCTTARAIRMRRCVCAIPVLRQITGSLCYGAEGTYLLGTAITTENLSRIPWISIWRS